MSNISAGFVLFRLGERTFATPLDEVREIVRLQGLERLPGTTPPLAGVIVLRGMPLPVLDVRAAGAPDNSGDILVIDSGADTVGVAVDEVSAVLHPDELPAADAAPKALPGYVVGVHTYRGGPVLLVDLQALLDTTAVGWQESLLTSQT
ncbi:MAG: purine-binding chemotaxis protein CheW [Frankiaceae bacterium]|nr:purine-binding chemotaxis protein CheW [Frankiaceae bacterium]